MKVWSPVFTRDNKIQALNCTQQFFMYVSVVASLSWTISLKFVLVSGSKNK